MKKQYLKIVARHDDYAPEGKTLTIGELKEILNYYSDDLEVYLSHDNGYTYGQLNENRIFTDTYYTEEDEE